MKTLDFNTCRVFKSLKITLLSELERRGRLEKLLGRDRDARRGHIYLGVPKGRRGQGEGERCLLGLVVSTRTEDTASPLITPFFHSRFLTRRIKPHPKA